LPGGWIDIGEAPSVAVEREVFEETGYTVRAVKLAALYDKLSHPHPPAPHHSYLLFILCELLSGEATPSVETLDVKWFAREALPELSRLRATEGQILAMFDHHDDPELPTAFD
jgi:ADP-ribose pyrophosphatase YjhB (NUDIX family)